MTWNTLSTLVESLPAEVVALGGFARAAATLRECHRLTKGTPAALVAAMAETRDRLAAALPPGGRVPCTLVAPRRRGGAAHAASPAAAVAPAASAGEP